MPYKYQEGISVRGKIACGIVALIGFSPVYIIHERTVDREEATELYTIALKKADIDEDHYLSLDEKVRLYLGMGLKGPFDFTNDPIGQAYLTRFRSLQGTDLDIDFVRTVIVGVRKYLDDLEEK